MAKKYYWLKLQKDFFKRHDIKIIKAMPNGKEYVIFYLMLLLESIDHEGALRFSDTIPYNDQMLATITDTNIDTVRSAMKILQELNMVEVLDDCTIYMREVYKMLGFETEWAKKKRLQRGQCPPDVPLMSESCPPNVRQEIELEIEKELEIDIEKEKDKGSMPSTGKPAPAPAVIEIILNDKSMYSITQQDIDKWEALYPAVEILSELRKMVGWCDANPAKRKTKAGINRFINNWLAREQDRGGNKPAAKQQAEPIPGFNMGEFL